VVVVDEAQNLSWDLLEEIRLLTNLETSSEKLLQIVLSGQPELEEKLKHPSVRQLRQRVSLWCRTQALTETQSFTYVAERLRIAGASWSIFTQDALERVHRYSRGIPRLINLVCEHSLIVAYVEQTRQVTPAMVEGVALELELETQPFLISTAAMGGGGREPQMRAAAGDASGLMTSFNRDLTGRHER
jgi:type II secretory pathway predicted ATPase ExeA